MCQQHLLFDIFKENQKQIKDVFLTDVFPYKICILVQIPASLWPWHSNCPVAGKNRWNHGTGRNTQLLPWPDEPRVALSLPC